MGQSRGTLCDRDHVPRTGAARCVGAKPGKTAQEGYSKSRIACGSILLSFQANSIEQSPFQSLVFASAGRYLLATLFSEHSGI
jgi:hypothetical protein